MLERGGDWGMSLSEMRRKDVINVCDGRKLGKPIDVIFSERAVVEAIVVPAPSGLGAMFARERQGCVIPWGRIKRFGDDVILVDVDPDTLACH